MRIAVIRSTCIGLVAGCLLISNHAQAQPEPGQYRVYPLPIASPDHGIRALLTDPADANASPFGWHDTNGANGAEFTILRGNNAWVYVDANSDNAPDGPGPDGGATLTFDYLASPYTLPPASQMAALATNAFYLVNSFHDILWHHGFQEVDGNFQENNYGRGGTGGDSVRVEIMDGSTINNANGSTGPADGTIARIQLGIWNAAEPDRGASYAADVVAFSYMQMAQARLLGNGCGLNSDTPVIGNQDFFAALVSNDFTSTTPAIPHGLATFLLNQPVAGNGIRAFPYSVDMTINPSTYSDSVGANVFGLGLIYASALWDMAWSLVQREGASNDLVTGDGGENRALCLQILALKLQPCSAGLLDGRDALLEADVNLYQGQYACNIWNAFARRGMGVSATQGSTNSTADNVAAFDTPASCADLIFADGFDP